jgi:hypothetical protein
MTPKLRPRQQAIQIAPGRAVLNLSGARGGVTYRTEVITDRTQVRHSRRVESRVVKTIDNEALVREIDAVIKNVDDTVMRRLCVKMTFGHFLPEHNAAELHQEIAQLRGRVEALNAAAVAMGSRHHGSVGVLTPALDIDDPHFVMECCRTVTAALTDVYAALQAGDIDDQQADGRVIRNALKPALLRAKNIEALAEGDAGTLLQQAFARVRSVKSEIRSLIAAGAPPDEAGRNVNLRDVERALQLFQVP